MELTTEGISLKMVHVFNNLQSILHCKDLSLILSFPICPKIYHLFSLSFKLSQQESCFLFQNCNLPGKKNHLQFAFSIKPYPVDTALSIFSYMRIKFSLTHDVKKLFSINSFPSHLASLIIDR